MNERTRRRIAMGFLFFFLATTSSEGQRLPIRESDTQNWNDVQLAVPINKRFDFLLIGHLRIGDNIRRPVDERIGVGFTFTPNKHLVFGANHLHIEMQSPGGVLSHEERLSFGVSVRFSSGKFGFHDRNVFEHRYRSPQVHATRYRNRFQVDYPIGAKRLQLRLFVNDEVFYDWSLNVWPRNRISVGISRRFNDHFTGEIYYLRQNDSHTRPGDLNVIGTTMRFHL